MKTFIDEAFEADIAIWFVEGYKKGFEEGYKKGFEEGVILGEQTAIQGWLEAFFGSRSNSLQERIGQIFDRSVLHQIIPIMDPSKGLEGFEKRLTEILDAHQNETSSII